MKIFIIIIALTCLTASARPPNVIIILADDLGYADLGCQGSKDIHTPNIDSLADSGIRYTRAYVTAPQCGPSRAGLMTGLNQSQFGYMDNSYQRGLPPVEVAPTLAEYLDGLGYTTGIVGKWHLGHEPNEPDKEAWPSAPWQRGFDYSYIFHEGSTFYFSQDGDWDKMLKAGRDPRMREVREGESTIRFLREPGNPYLTDLFTRKGIEFIERNNDRPFFLYVAYNAPHAPLQATLEDLRENKHIPPGPRRTFAAMMTALDRGVGDIVKTLKEEHIESETIVIFLSDNGAPTNHNASLNDPWRGQKGQLLEGGIRIPMIISWPDTISPEQTSDAMVSSLDILPTLVSISEGKLNPEVSYPGVDISTTWEHGHSFTRDYLLWSWRSMVAVHQGPWKLMEAVEGPLPIQGAAEDVGLYNLLVSPKEDKKIEDKNVSLPMAELIDDWKSSIEDTMASDENEAYFDFTTHRKDYAEKYLQTPPKPDNIP